jgi:hypothetical protein
MYFDKSVPAVDRKRIRLAVDDIKKHGDMFQRLIAGFIEDTDIRIYLDLAAHVGGSGSVCLDDHRAARRAVRRGNLNPVDAAGHVRLNIARETIDTGGQRGIEGTFIHEGKHALDFAQMLASFSNGDEAKIFNPTAFQRELSAHLTSALYLMRRGGEYAAEGVALGLLRNEKGSVKVDPAGIRHRLRNNYGLTEESPGKRLNTASYPPIGVPRRKLFGIF